jgi:hypothetical protein
MNKLKNIFLILAVIPFFNLFGQKDKKEIISSFDKIEYYSDSTIKCVYKLKKGLYNGYAIEFDSAGLVKAIGKYENGKKDGCWQNSNLSWTTYTKGEEGSTAVPNYDYAPEKQKAKENFKKLYLDLIKSD